MEGVIEGQKNLTKYITDFYKKLFGEAERCQITFDTRRVDKINSSDADGLVACFSLEELKTTVFGMELNKAVGPAGFNAEFYQKF